MTTPPPPVPGSPVPCVRHPDRPTVLACTRCGRPACPDCLREASVGQHCVDCAAADARSAPRYRGGGTSRPVVVITLIAVNVAVFVLTAVTAGSVGDNAQSPLFELAALRPYDVSGGQWWQLVTSGFLHFGPLHLLFNMIALWVIGTNLEYALGPGRLAALYGTSLLGGSVAVMLFTPPGTSTAGASGAVFGLMGALAVLLRRRRFPIGQVGTVIAINVLLTFTIGGLSIAGHLGGLAVGALTALALDAAPSRARSGAGPAVLVGGIVAVLVVLTVVRAVVLY